jgi:hypothetical protein
MAVGTMGIGLDYGDFGWRHFRQGMKQRFAETCRRLVTAKPETSHDNFLRDFGRAVRAWLQSCVNSRLTDERSVR